MANRASDSPVYSLLVCAATPMELRAFDRGAIDRLGLCDARPFAPADNVNPAFLLTGVGIPCTLGRLFTLANPSTAFRLVLNVGIAGAYPGGGLSVGDIVIGSEEVYGDVGFETPPGAPGEPAGFETFAASPLGASFYGQPLALAAPPQWVCEPANAACRIHAGRRGATVNACTGTDATGARRELLSGAAFETMEGAAVAQWGRQTGTPVCEVRAISNIAARRDMRPQNIRLALENLAHYLAACRQSKGALDD